MTLRDLLELLKDNLGENSDQVSGPSDRYWSDATLVAYLNTAQREFCDKSRSLIDDSTPEVTRIALKDATSSYALHPSVIGVTHVYLDTVGDLEAKPREFVREVCSSRLSRPSYFFADVLAKRLFVAGTPTTASGFVGKKLELRVARFPLCELTLNKPEASPEIDPQFHEVLTEYAMYRALRKHDSDAENLTKAQAHLQLFEATALRARNLYKEQGALSAEPTSMRNWGFP